MNKEDFYRLIERIGTERSRFPPDNTLPLPVLYAIYEHCGSNIPFTMETGTGLSTILFSHISMNHKVFALNDRNMTNVKTCKIFNSQNVEFIEGPTQKTLPFYNFSSKFSVVLLDGPHGYPFPELEYYYTYQHIENSGILIIDDIRIPTIHNLFSFLKEEDMFELLEVVGGNTAFFRRTSAPLFNPYGDGWWLQKYNKKYYPVSEFEGVIARRMSGLNDWRRSLNRLWSSRMWRIASRAHQIIDMLLPVGTRRRKFIGSAFRRVMRL